MPIIQLTSESSPMPLGMLAPKACLQMQGELPWASLGFVSHYFISCCFTFFRSSTQCLRNPQHSSSVAAINGNVYFLLQVPPQEPWRLSSCHQFYAVAQPSSLEITSLPCITPPTSKSLPLSYCTPKLQYGTRALQGINLFSPDELYIRKGG